MSKCNRRDMFYSRERGFRPKSANDHSGRLPDGLDEAIAKLQAARESVPEEHRHTAELCFSGDSLFYSVQYWVPETDFEWASRLHELESEEGKRMLADRDASAKRERRRSFERDIERCKEKIRKSEIGIIELQLAQAA